MPAHYIRPLYCCCCYKSQPLRPYLPHTKAKTDASAGKVCAKQNMLHKTAAEITAKRVDGSSDTHHTKQQQEKAGQHMGSNAVTPPCYVLTLLFFFSPFSVVFFFLPPPVLLFLPPLEDTSPAAGPSPNLLPGNVQTHPATLGRCFHAACTHLRASNMGLGDWGEWGDYARWVQQ